MAEKQHKHTNSELFPLERSRRHPVAPVSPECETVLVPNLSVPPFLHLKSEGMKLIVKK